jgi:hypothetical protein
MRGYSKEFRERLDKQKERIGFDYRIRPLTPEERKILEDSDHPLENDHHSEGE